MAKGLRNGRQLSDSLTMGVDVVGGNGMYTAQPLGAWKRVVERGQGLLTRRRVVKWNAHHSPAHP
jgi:hypothetical protein